jgi:hypothetical protein
MFGVGSLDEMRASAVGTLGHLKTSRAAVRIGDTPYRHLLTIPKDAGDARHTKETILHRKPPPTCILASTKTEIL